MSSQLPPAIKRAYQLFEGINFSECDGCSKCCYLPWLLKEEYPQMDNFGKTVKEIDSIAFIMNSTACKYARENKCYLYADRPLDCRLFPLDIIEEDGKYWWGIFTLCPKHREIKNKLIPLIPKLEAVITPEIFDQYQKQIKISKIIYSPYKLKQYEKIKRFRGGISH